jgi:hypothetical protein
MTFSIMWVPPIGWIPKRYPGQAPGGLTSWAGLVGFGQVSFSLYFFLFDSFSFSSIFYLLIFI